MIKSEWKIKNPNSLLEATAVTDTKERKKTTKSPKQEEAISVGKRTKNGEDENVKGTADVNLVVATIIASITFTAGMAMPGGYDGSTGLAYLRKKPSFRYFLAFDSLAFGCSAASMVMHFAVSVHMKLRGKAYKYPIQMTTLLTFLSITLTVLTFVMGTFTVLYEVRSGFSSKSGFGLPGNIAFAAFLATLLYFFTPLLLAFQNYVAGILAPDSEAMMAFAKMFSKLPS